MLHRVCERGELIPYRGRYDAIRGFPNGPVVIVEEGSKETRGFLTRTNEFQ
jgi:hypothetical protein